MNINTKIVTIGGKEYNYPDWTFGVIQRMIKTSAMVSSGEMEEYTAVPLVISYALIRDYNEVTPEFVDKWLSLDEAIVFNNIYAEQTGKLTKKKSQETLTQQTNPFTGEDFTPESSPLQDGLGNT